MQGVVNGILNHVPAHNLPLFSMKKTILSLALALVALAVSAQRTLEANQRLVGYYTSDDIDNSLSFTSAPGKMQAGAYLVPNDYVQ